jgi:hypothetical protein
MTKTKKDKFINKNNKIKKVCMGAISWSFLPLGN